MITRYSFTCAVCGKEYTVNGYWWNQWVMHHWIDYRYLIHSIIHHRKKLKVRGIFFILKMTLLWIPLIVLQVIDILLQPLRWILWANG